MPPSFTEMTQALHDYMLEMGVREGPELAALREETLQLPNGYWASTPEEAAFLQILVRAMGARRVLEIGTFTGYATLALAQALPEDGTLVTCEVASGWSEMGAHYWRSAGVHERIDLRIGRATDVMAELIADGQGGSFDLAFLDADKRSYLGYLEQVAALLRPGGLLVANRVFRRGAVVPTSKSKGEAMNLRRFNEALRDDPRFQIAMIPLADGVTLAVKK